MGKVLGGKCGLGSLPLPETSTLDHPMERPGGPLELREMETHLLGVEVAIAVAVGDGNDVEVLVGAALGGGQPLQGPVQLALAGALGLEEREGESTHQRGQKEGQENQCWGSRLGVLAGLREGRVWRQVLGTLVERAEGH